MPSCASANPTKPMLSRWTKNGAWLNGIPRSFHEATSSVANGRSSDGSCSDFLLSQAARDSETLIFQITRSRAITRCCSPVSAVDFGDSCRLYKPRKRMGSGDPSGLQNRRELALLALVSSTLTRFRHHFLPQ